MNETDREAAKPTTAGPAGTPAAPTAPAARVDERADERVEKPADEQDHERAAADLGEERKTLGPRLIIEQAASDIGHGLQDTDLHGIPSNVPGPGPAPENTPGAEVPPEGGDRRSYAEDQTGHHKTGSK